MSYGASEMNPMKCRCNSCVNGLDGSNGAGYQPCASKLKAPPTVEYRKTVSGWSFPYTLILINAIVFIYLAFSGA